VKKTPKAMYSFFGILTAVFGLCLCYQKDGKCYNNVNVIIALDASGSINIESWQSGIGLAKQIIQSISFADSGNKFAIIEFSNTARIVQQLSSNSIEAINSLNNMKNGVKGGHTYIDVALNEALKIFDSITSSQGNSQNVLVTVSDGYMTYHNGQDIFDILKAPVEQLKGKKVQLYAVSVGSLVKDKTLQFITTGPGYIFKSDQASNLIEGIKKGSETDCQKIVCSTVAVSRTDKGCYRDNHQANNRPLPDMIFTDRDSGSDKYSKVPLDWKNWASYLKGLVCRCAEAVNKMKRTIFGLQFYGECWSSAVNNTYANHGPAEDNKKCVSNTTLYCDANMLYCVGISSYNFVYKIVP